MANSTFGTRWVCYGCGVRFFDLNKPEAVCPKCKADQRQDPKRTAVAKARSKPKKDIEVFDDRFDEDDEFDGGADDDGLDDFADLESTGLDDDEADSDEEEQDDF